MTKSELILRISKGNPELGRRSAETVVNSFFGEITTALVLGNRVELRGFGIFTVRKRNSRTGRNPRTGVAVPVSEKQVPFFRPGKTLRDRLNSPSSEALPDPPNFRR